MLACARIGAVHSVVFGGFSAEALRERMNDAGAKVLHHRGRRLAQGRGGAAEGERATRRCRRCPRWRRWSSLQRTGKTPPAMGPKDVAWDELVAQPGRHLRAGVGGERAPAVHPLHLGLDREAEGRAAHHRRLRGERLAHHALGVRPEGRRHLLVHRGRGLGDGAQLRRLRPADERRDDRHVRGRAHARRGRIGSGRSSRGTRSPSSTRRRRRSAPSCGWARSTRRSTTCRRCGCWASVGEPINPEAWIWYRDVIGGGRCPIVDTWWQTETGGDHDLAAAGRDADQAGSATLPLPGIEAEVLDKDGQAGAARAGRAALHRPGRGRRCCARSTATRSGT